MLSAAVPGAARVSAATQRREWPALREELQLESATANRDGSPAWHICDPVRNLFFRIGWLEFEILQRWSMADARRIADDVAERTTLVADADDVEGFLAFLTRHQLLRTPRPKAERPLWRWMLDNYLFIRIPLVRPRRWLQWLLPRLGWLYTPGFVGLTVLAALAGLLLAARQWDVVRASLHGALSWEGVIGFAGALVLSKLLHEMGHALMATRHGVRVGHMGIALLVLWPMAYTDTGESWKLARSRHRLAIASAGICAELVLAAWSTLAWALVPDGDLRNALFFLATTAWVLTLAINASPFMRFDGYYILTDALDFPGLHERSGRLARRAMRRWLLGLREPAPESLPPGMTRFLTVFAFATWIYRLILFVGIALLVYHAFFKALGVLLFVVEISVFIGRPVLAEMRVWRARRAEIAPACRLAWLAALVAILLALGLPWSTRIDAPGVLHAGVEQLLYPPFSARLVSMDLADDMPVKAGQVLLTLDAPLQGSERDKARALAAAYALAARGALGLEDEGAARSALARQQAVHWETEGSAREAELQRLHLVAGGPGHVRDLDPLLAPGVWVNPSRPIAIVVNSQRWRAEALVSERDRQRLTEGEAVTLIVKGRTRKLEGRIVAVDGTAVKRLPSLLLAQPHGGPIPLNPAEPAKELRPASAWFRVVAEGEADPDDPETVRVREVRLHTQGTAESLARRWIEAALSALIRQGAF